MSARNKTKKKECNMKAFKKYVKASGRLRHCIQNCLLLSGDPEIRDIFQKWNVYYCILNRSEVDVQKVANEFPKDMESVILKYISNVQNTFSLMILNDFISKAADFPGAIESPIIQRINGSLIVEQKNLNIKQIAEELKSTVTTTKWFMQSTPDWMNELYTKLIDKEKYFSSSYFINRNWKRVLRMRKKFFNEVQQINHKNSNNLQNFILKDELSQSKQEIAENNHEIKDGESNRNNNKSNNSISIDNNSNANHNKNKNSKNCENRNTNKNSNNKRNNKENILYKNETSRTNNNKDNNRDDFIFGNSGSLFELENRMDRFSASNNFFESSFKTNSNFGCESFNYSENQNANNGALNDSEDSFVQLISGKDNMNCAFKMCLIDRNDSSSECENTSRLHNSAKYSDSSDSYNNSDYAADGDSDAFDDKSENDYNDNDNESNSDDNRNDNYSDDISNNNTNYSDILLDSNSSKNGNNKRENDKNIKKNDNKAYNDDKNSNDDDDDDDEASIDNMSDSRISSIEVEKAGQSSGGSFFYKNQIIFKNESFPSPLLTSSSSSNTNSNSSKTKRNIDFYENEKKNDVSDKEENNDNEVKNQIYSSHENKDENNENMFFNEKKHDEGKELYYENENAFSISSDSQDNTDSVIVEKPDLSDIISITLNQSRNKIEKNEFIQAGDNKKFNNIKYNNDNENHNNMAFSYKEILSLPPNNAVYISFDEYIKSGKANDGMIITAPMHPNDHTLSQEVESFDVNRNKPIKRNLKQEQIESYKEKRKNELIEEFTRETIKKYQNQKEKEINKILNEHNLLLEKELPNSGITDETIEEMKRKLRKLQKQK